MSNPIKALCMFAALLGLFISTIYGSIIAKTLPELTIAAVIGGTCLALGYLASNFDE